MPLPFQGPPSLHDTWQAASDFILPRNCPKPQADDLRRAYYAGAQGVLTALLFSENGEAAPSADMLKQIVLQIAKMQKEMEDFSADVRAGLK